MSTLITFEHPLNERIRTFLRLEHLFEQLERFLAVANPWATRAAIDALLDIVATTARADIKNDLLKELDRLTVTLTRFANQPGIDGEALDEAMQDLATAALPIRHLHGPFGQHAREDEFLKSIGQRSSIPGGTCSFDLPQFFYWLTEPAEVRQERFDVWMEDLRPAGKAVKLALSLIRSGGGTRKMLAEEGFFQESLDTQVPVQMLRVTLDRSDCIYPEISGHKNRFSIRFMRSDTDGRTAQYTRDVSFRLTCCAF